MTTRRLPKRFRDNPGELIAAALEVLEERIRYGAQLTSPSDVRNWLRLRLGTEERELFCCIWLDVQHRVIEMEVLFQGTLSQASVHPREVVKSALKHNAASVILAHNHPSGAVEPSMADRSITERLQDALALVDVRVLDHIVIGHGGAFLSFAERGLL